MESLLQRSPVFEDYNNNRPHGSLGKIVKIKRKLPKFVLWEKGGNYTLMHWKFQIINLIKTCHGVD